MRYTSAMRQRAITRLLGCVLFLAACTSNGEQDDAPILETVPAGGGSNSSGGSPACSPPAFVQAIDPGAPAALIVTNRALQPAFDEYAALHSVTGIATKTVAVEDICAGKTCDENPRSDTAKAIKEYLKAQPGLRYVILGGGGDVIPGRKVHDAYTNPTLTQYSFSADFVTDYYYSDFSEWDTNGDGVYAQKEIDTPSYSPSVTVARIPVHTAKEAADYLAKVVHHVRAYDTAKVQKALLLSNIAAKVFGVDIDAAWYFASKGRTLSRIPANFVVTKQYANPTDASAGVYSAQNESAAIMDGQNVVVHSGHASYDLLTVEVNGSQPFTGEQAYALTNATRPIFLSSGCQAGDYSAPYRAGELLVLAPAGGAIAYLGNVPVGLGLAGGMQVIDGVLGYVQTHPNALLADAYFDAHQRLPKSDTFQIPIIPIAIQVLDQNSYQWTQKSVVLFGDPLIPVWTKPLPSAPQISVSKKAVCGGAELSFTFGAPVTGTIDISADGELYRVPLDKKDSLTIAIARDPVRVSAGLVDPESQYAFASAAF